MPYNFSVNFVSKLLQKAGYKEKAKEVDARWARDKQRTEEGLIDEVAGAQGEFGFEKTNPIPVADPKGEDEYLSRLRCPCGEPFFFHRAGNGGPGPDGHIVDIFELICRKKAHRYTLFLDMYHVTPSTKPPGGLSLSTPEGVGMTKWIENFDNMTYEDMKRLGH
jgi:hypothetical protein